MFSFSIIIPVFNVSEYIIKTLQSIKRQTYKNFFLIIIDDGSTDNTLDLINSFLKKSSLDYSILDNKTNKGLRYSRIKGLEIANGDYVIQFDGDDILFPHALERLNEILIANDFDFIAYERIDFADKMEKLPPKKHADIITIYESIFSLPLHEVNPISIWRYAVKRELVQKVYSKQKVNINFGEDMIFIAHLFLEARQLTFYPEPLMFYRKRSKSMTDYSIFSINYLMDLVMSHKYVFDLWGGKEVYPANYFNFQLLPFRDRILTSLKKQFSSDVFEKAMCYINQAYTSHNDFAVRQELKRLFPLHKFRNTYQPNTIDIKI